MWDENFGDTLILLSIPIFSITITLIVSLICMIVKVFQSVPEANKYFDPCIAFVLNQRALENLV